MRGPADRQLQRLLYVYMHYDLYSLGTERAALEGSRQPPGRGWKGSCAPDLQMSVGGPAALWRGTVGAGGGGGGLKATPVHNPSASCPLSVFPPTAPLGSDQGRLVPPLPGKTRWGLRFSAAAQHRRCTAQSPHPAISSLFRLLILHPQSEPTRTSRDPAESQHLLRTHCVFSSHWS